MKVILSNTMFLQDNIKFYVYIRKRQKLKKKLKNKKERKVPLDGIGLGHLQKLKYIKKSENDVEHEKG